jgi:hypothetical protein
MNGRSQSRLGVDGMVMTRRSGLSLPDDLSMDRWRRVGEQIFVVVDSSSWWLGDWLVFGENKFPDRYKQVIETTSLDYQTLRNYAWVARKFPIHRRREKLSFQHHVEVARLPEDQQDAWLERAEQAGWSRNQLRRRLRLSRDGGQVNGGHAGIGVELSVNVSAERRQRWQQAAENAGVSLVDWVVVVVDRAAEGVLDGNDVLPAL